MTIVCCVFGLPGAGKSAVCREVARMAATQYDVHIEEFDDTLAQQMESNDVFSPAIWRSAKEKHVLRWESVLRSTLMMTSIASRATPMHLLLIVDNYYYKSSRMEVCDVVAKCNQQAKECGSCASFVTAFVDAPVVLCQERNALRHGMAQVPAHVLTRMGDCMEASALRREGQTVPQATLRNYGSSNPHVGHNSSCDLPGQLHHFGGSACVRARTGHCRS